MLDIFRYIPISGVQPTSKCSTSGAEPFRIKGLKAKYITAGLLMCFSTAVLQLQGMS